MKIDYMEDSSTNSEQAGEQSSAEENDILTSYHSINKNLASRDYSNNKALKKKKKT